MERKMNLSNKKVVMYRKQTQDSYLWKHCLNVRSSEGTETFELFINNDISDIFVQN